jgi:hypothetical protein
MKKKSPSGLKKPPPNFLFIAIAKKNAMEKVQILFRIVIGDIFVF